MTPFSEYLDKLLHDDKALVAFLEHPIHAVAEENKGKPQHEQIKKTDRAILRRILVSASTNTPSGYAVIRSSDSYRSAIRMLQNVLHHHEAAGMVHGLGMNDIVVTGIRIYYSGDPSNPGTNPYANSVTGYSLRSPTLTVKEALDQAVWRDGATVSYETVTMNGQLFVKTFTINGVAYTAPPTDTLGTPFWFYSFDGRPHPTARGVVDPSEPDAGQEGASFADAQVGGHGGFSWEVIAPASYGYGACKLTLASDDEVYQKEFTPSK